MALVAGWGFYYDPANPSKLYKDPQGQIEINAQGQPIYKYANGPGPAEYQAWSNQRSRAKDQYGTDLAGITFQRNMTSQQQGLDVNKMNRYWDMTRERLPGGYAKRGLLNSGIYGKGLENYGIGRTSASRDLSLAYQKQFGGLNQQARQAGTSYRGAIGAVDDMEAVRRQQLATQLKLAGM